MFYGAPFRRARAGLPCGPGPGRLTGIAACVAPLALAPENQTVSTSTQHSFFRRYLLPGFVFQSVVIAGGYGTGRELVEFFLTQGPRGGLMAMLLVSTVIWSATCAVTFDFARRFSTYDYRTFFRRLLGWRWWVAYEVAYLAFLMLVLAVIAAAAGSILEETFGISYTTGVVGMIAAIGYLVFRGSRTIERFFAGWSFVLYAVFVLFFILCFVSFGGEISQRFATVPAGEGWFLAGVRYAAYNLATIPGLLFVMRHVGTRREAVSAGLLAGPIAIIPGVLFYLAMVGQYPEILDRTVPANALLDTLGMRWFQLAFQLALFGTLIETGAGMIHAVNERVAAVYARGKAKMPARLRTGIGTGLLAGGALIAQFGLIDLIARGYGTMTWVFLAVYVAPVLTVGVWKLARGGSDRPSRPGQATLS